MKGEIKMRSNVRIIDECGCSKWAKAFVKTVLKRVNIQTEEIVIWDMTYKHINLRAEVWDAELAAETEGEAPGGWVEKYYSIRYYEDAKNVLRLLLSYRFYDNEEVIEETVRPDGSVVRNYSRMYLDEGAYRVFGYWLVPAFARIKD